MWESPQTLVASILGPQNLSLRPLAPKSHFAFVPLTSNPLFFLVSSVTSLQLSHSLHLSFEKWLCEQVWACQKRVNHRYECIHILDFFLHPMPKGKIKPNVGSFITNMSLAATSCAISEMFSLAAETVIFEN